MWIENLKQRSKGQNRAFGLGMNQFPWRLFLLEFFTWIWRGKRKHGGEHRYGCFYSCSCFLDLNLVIPTMFPWQHPMAWVGSEAPGPPGGVVAWKTPGSRLASWEQAERRKLIMPAFDTGKGRQHELKNVSLLLSSWNFSDVWRALTPQSTKNKIASKWWL